MRKTALAILIFLPRLLSADIAPASIVLKGIYPNHPNEIQIVSETVHAILSKDSSFVTCVFTMYNHGESITIPVGFPAMDFHHWGFYHPYHPANHNQFEIVVDSKKVGEDHIVVPQELEALYHQYLHIREESIIGQMKLDSLYSALGVVRRKNGNTIYPADVDSIIQVFLKRYQSADPLSDDFDWENYSSFRQACIDGDYPWYVWDVEFKKGQTRTIEVRYKVPTGMGYGGKHRYFNYLLNTGAGWYKDIEFALVTIDLINLAHGQIDSIKPSNGILENKCISYSFSNLEPAEEHDIYVQFHLNSEMGRFKRNRKKLRIKSERVLGKQTRTSIKKATYKTSSYTIPTLHTSPGIRRRSYALEEGIVNS